MARQSQFENELQTLRALCDGTSPRQRRQELLHALTPQSFCEPQHQVIFESIRALFPRGEFSPEQLRIHLNNRGFPDTDADRYFQPAQIENSDPQ